MKIWKEGDRSRGVCEVCKRLVDTRFERRTLPLEQPRIDVPDVLVDVCEVCGSILSVPPQSLPRINAARQREPVRLEARISKELDDVLGWVTSQYAGRLDAFRGALLRYYLDALVKEGEMATRVKRLANADLAHGKQDERIHLRLEKPLLDRAWAAAQSVGIADKSEMIRGLILAAAEDAERPTPTRRAAFEALAVAAAV